MPQNKTTETILKELSKRQFPSSSIIIDSSSTVPTGEYSGILVLQSLSVSSITLSGATEDKSGGVAGLLGDASPGAVIQPLYFTDINLSGGSAIIF